MNASVQRMYWVSRPAGMTSLTGGDFDVSGTVTGALMTTRLSTDRKGSFRCHTRALPEDLDLAACLAQGGAARTQVRDLLTDMLAAFHTGAGRRPRTLSGAELASEAERILESSDYTPCVIAVDDVPVPGVRFNSSLVAADADEAGMFLVVHHGHLVTIESHNGAGDPQVLSTDSDVAAVRTAL